MASDHFGPFRVVLNGSLSVIEGTFQKTMLKEVKRIQEAFQNVECSLSNAEILTLLFETNYSRIDQVKFVEGCL